MDDLKHVGTLFLLFAASLALYGALLVRSGDVGLLPMRAQHSVRGPQDVRHVGRIVVFTGVVIGAIALIVRLLADD